MVQLNKRSRGVETQPPSRYGFQTLGLPNDKMCDKCADCNPEEAVATQVNFFMLALRLIRSVKDSLFSLTGVGSDVRVADVTDATDVHLGGGGRNAQPSPSGRERRPYAGTCTRGIRRRYLLRRCRRCRCGLT